MKSRSKRKIPEINSSAAADISFLLLIFFIITSSMDPDWIMPMHLSPPPPKENTKHIEIKERDYLPIFIDDENRIFCNNIEVNGDELKGLVKNFIDNPENKENLPEKTSMDIPFFGKASITQNHIIALTNGEKTSFQTYIFVQNELIAAYNELRNELAQKKLGRPYSKLNSEEQKAVRTYYPRKISKPEKIREGGTP